MASWKESKKIGDDFEIFVAKQITEILGLMVERNTVPEKYKFYDLTLSNGKTVECKCDKKAEESKNICIETHCEGIVSGISATTANYWMITDNISGFLIKTSELKRCIYEGYTSLYPDEPTKFRHMHNCPVEQEDGTMKLMDFYTIPIWLFLDYCVETKEIDKMTYNELL